MSRTAMSEGAYVAPSSVTGGLPANIGIGANATFPASRRTQQQQAFAEEVEESLGNPGFGGFAAHGEISPGVRNIWAGKPQPPLTNQRINIGDPNQNLLGLWTRIGNDQMNNIDIANLTPDDFSPSQERIYATAPNMTQATATDMTQWLDQVANHLQQQGAQQGANIPPPPPLPPASFRSRGGAPQAPQGGSVFRGGLGGPNITPEQASAAAGSVLAQPEEEEDILGGGLAKRPRQNQRLAGNHMYGGWANPPQRRASMGVHPSALRGGLAQFAAGNGRPHHHSAGFGFSGGNNSTRRGSSTFRNTTGRSHRQVTGQESFEGMGMGTTGNNNNNNNNPFKSRGGNNGNFNNWASLNAAAANQWTTPNVNNFTNAGEFGAFTGAFNRPQQQQQTAGGLFGTNYGGTSNLAELLHQQQQLQNLNQNQPLNVSQLFGNGNGSGIGSLQQQQGTTAGLGSTSFNSSRLGGNYNSQSWRNTGGYSGHNSRRVGSLGGSNQFRWSQQQ